MCRVRKTVYSESEREIGRERDRGRMGGGWQKERKQFLPKRYNLSNFPNWTMHAKQQHVCDVRSMLCSTSIKSRQEWTACEHMCVCTVHASDYADAVCHQSPFPYIFMEKCCKRTLSKNHLCKNFNNFVVPYNQLSFSLSLPPFLPFTRSLESTSSRNTISKQKPRRRGKKWIFHWHVNRTNWNCTLKILIQN